MASDAKEEMMPDSASSPSGGVRTTGYLAMFSWLSVILLVVTGLQLSIPYPLDDDTAYHFSVARLIREHGILHSFHWTRFSWQYDHYADKEFLFHLLFVPFTPLGFNTAARIVGIVGGTASLAAIYFILVKERVRFAGFWALLPLGTIIFVYRFSQVRPHLFSIALALVLLWAYCRRSYWILAITSVIYPLTYVAFWQIPLMMIVAAEVGRFLAGKRGLRWKPMAVVSVGIAAGIVLHPNAYNLLQMSWIHMTDILFRNAWGGHVEFNLGEEFEPFSVSEWMENLLPTAVMAGAALWQAWLSRRGRPVVAAFAVATLFFCLLTMRTNRFLEYFVPFTVVTFALISENWRTRWLVPSLVAVFLLYTAVTGMPLMQYLAAHDEKPWHFTPHVTFFHFPGMEKLNVHDERNWQMGAAAVAAIERLLPKDADVFTCGWEYTGSLLLNLPERDYMVALDPTLFYKRHPLLYVDWYDVLAEPPPNAGEIVRERFASRYALCFDHKTLHPFFDALARDEGTQVLYSDGKWVLFDLGKGAR